MGHGSRLQTHNVYSVYARVQMSAKASRRFNNSNGSVSNDEHETWWTEPLTAFVSFHTDNLRQHQHVIIVCLSRSSYAQNDGSSLVSSFKRCSGAKVCCFLFRSTFAPLSCLQKVETYLLTSGRCACAGLSSLNQLEREEEAYEAKMKGIADIQAALPIGVTPAIMARYEKKVKELRDTSNDMPAFKPVWNRQPQSEQPLPSLAHQSPGSMSRPASDFSFALSTPRSMQFHTPQQTPQSARSMASGDSSYNLDSSHDETSDVETPGSRMSTASTAGR